MYLVFRCGKDFVKRHTWENMFELGKYCVGMGKLFVEVLANRDAVGVILLAESSSNVCLMYLITLMEETWCKIVIFNNN